MTDQDREWMADFSPAEGGPSFLLGKLSGQIENLTIEILKLREASHKATNELTVLTSIKEDIVDLRTLTNRLDTKVDSRFVALELRTNTLELELRDRSKYWTGMRAPAALIVYFALGITAVIGSVVATEAFIASHWRPAPSVTITAPPLQAR